MTVHTFNESSRFEDRCEATGVALWLFKSMWGHEFIRSDRIRNKAQQKAGTDHMIHLRDRTLRVDLKYRRPKFDGTDLLVEVESSKGRIGWGIDPSKENDLVIWVFMGPCLAFVVPRLALLTAAVPNWQDWGPLREAKNDSWVTRFVTPSVGTLAKAMGRSIRARRFPQRYREALDG